MDAKDDGFAGVAYRSVPDDGKGFAITHEQDFHKNPHIWRIDGVTWHSVASFKNRAEAELFRDWINELVDNQQRLVD